MKESSKMTTAAASRIQAATAKATRGIVSKDSFAARAQASASRNTTAASKGKSK